MECPFPETSLGSLLLFEEVWRLPSNGSGKRIDLFGSVYPAHIAVPAPDPGSQGHALVTMVSHYYVKPGNLHVSSRILLTIF